MTRKQILAIVAATSVAVAGGLAYAGQQRDESKNGENDAVAVLSKANVNLTQAVFSAEQHASGKATRATLDDENGKAVYEIEVVNGGKVTDVKVDGADGKILSAKADQADRGHQDQEDDD